MTRIKPYSILFNILILNAVNFVFCDLNPKSSLTFVIDATGSMGNDIAQVKENINQVLDVVLYSNTTQVENFILIIFRDPDVNVITDTKDPDQFRRGLASIDVYGGLDCPEFSMSGIQKGLELSEKGSLMFVFTDASSRDYNKYGTVRELAIRKGIQIDFLLSDHCTIDIELGNEQVYYDLARGTKGLVFDVKKKEVGKFMNYVRELVKGRQATIFSEDIPAGLHHINYNVDANMKELLISIRGQDPEVNIYDPTGNQADTEEIIRTPTAVVLKVDEVTPGVYRADLKSKIPMSVKISATDTFSFKCGFSLLEPSSIEETVPEPLPNQNSFMAIKLEATSPVQLRAVQIMDLNHKLIENLHLLPYDYKKQFYITDPFLPPNSDFYIAITGLEKNTNNLITRYSLTPVRQQRVIVATENKAPGVKIMGNTSLHADYREPLQLKCKISGYPKPEVQWKDKEGNVLTQSQMMQIEIPYDFLSVLRIEEVNKNDSYTCEATNTYGFHKQTVEVLTIRNKYFDILETPKDKIVKHKTKAVFNCIINALPEAKIQWVRIVPGDTRYLKTNKDFEISDKGSKLTIKNMGPHLVGRYRCLAQNSEYRKRFMFSVSIDGYENPKIERLPNNFEAVEGMDVAMTCRVLRGKPKPQVKWYHYPNDSPNHKEFISNEETLQIKQVNRRHAGSYLCIASNDGGDDDRFYTLKVEYAPDIVRGNKQVFSPVGEKIKLPCDVDGVPKPEVNWYRNGDQIKQGSEYHILSDNTLKFSTSLNNNGTYTCEAINSHGKDSIAINLKTFVKVSIDPAVRSKRYVLVGSSETLTCVVRGEPKPIQRWSFVAHGSKKRVIIRNFNKDTGSLELTNIQLAQRGEYYCRAMNIGSHNQIIYKIEVEAPPSIKKPTSNKIHAVEKDKSLILSCNAMGNPEPSVVWKKDGLTIKESESYRILEDNSLEIVTVTFGSSGVYRCKAKNRYGADRIHFEVYVDESPVIPTEVKQQEIFMEGEPASISCGLKYDPYIDSLRWYKNGKYLTSGPLDFNGIQSSDEGIYSCRVSHDGTSRSAHVDVKVGSKPSFVNPTDLTIQFQEGAVAVMDCEVSGSPKPEIVWWHSNSQIPEPDQQHRIVMSNINRGIYICLVSNRFGKIYRKFEIATEECVLNVTSDFGINQPLLVNKESINMPRYENIDGLIRVPSMEVIHLLCPSGFSHSDSKGATKLQAKCEGANNFEVNGRRFSYSDLTCQNHPKPTLTTNGDTCLGDSKKFNMGYEAEGEFFNVYEICLNDLYTIPLYVKHTMHHSLANVDSNPIWTYTTDFNLDESYDCDRQVSEVSSVLGVNFHQKDKCCFAKMQLVGSADVAPGAPQLATFSDANVLPHWSTCNGQNWRNLEKRVRKLATSLNNDLTVWTGVSDQLEMESATGAMIKMFITDKHGQKQPVPLFLWKVIQDSVTKAAIAVIQVNVPDFKITDAFKYLRCNDICSDVNWLKSLTWRSPNRGFTYCCELDAFATAFNLQDEFYGRSHGILS